MRAQDGRANRLARDGVPLGVRVVLAAVVAFLVLAAPASANVAVSNVAIADPSSAAAARTTYVIDLSTNTALSGAAGDRFTLNFPPTTGVGSLSDSHITVGAGPDLGGCFGIDADSIECSLNSGASIPGGSNVRITVKGLVNPTSAGAKQLSAFSST